MIFDFLREVLNKLAAFLAALFLLKENARFKYKKQEAEEDRDFYEHEANSWSNKPSGNNTVIRLRDAAERKKKNRS